MDDASSQIVRGYELQEQIGQGGHGVVYRAHQPIVSRDVAIKIILPHYANHPEFIRRFEAEAQFVARLEHLHIVPLYDYWREPGGAYLVMRWLRGGSLSTNLASARQSITTIMRLLDQIGSALAAAHQRGVVHRDLKPANILLDEDGNFFLNDFGIAKDLDQTTSLSQSDPMNMMGSPAYMAPEQITANPITAQTDIYSLGIVLYELLTGELPFRATTPVEMLFKHVNEPFPPLQMGRADLPPSLDAILQRATAKNPAERYHDVLSLVDDFRHIVMARHATMPDRVATEPDVALALGTVPSVPPASRQRETLVFELEHPLINPYKGLRAFQEADGSDFFGREALTRQLLARLTEPGTTARFLAIVGPSGSGKSSVARAGLVPALRRGALPGSERWFVVEMQPGAQPLQELERALLRVAANPLDRLLEWLQQDVQSLRRVIPRLLPGGANSEMVLVIDQFEELFTLVEDEATRAHVLDVLYDAVTDPLSRLRVVITLRADFYDRPLLYPNFGTLIRTCTEVVLPLATTELAQAIVSPAHRAGVRLEQGLETAIVANVNEQPGALPLLQYAMTELFERRDGRLLTYAAYYAIGGVNGALARRAEELYDQLDSEGQLTARQVFLRLVALGEAGEDTRRRTQLSEIGDWQSATGSGVPISQRQSSIASVLDLYGRHRLLTFDSDPVTREPTVEVAHEALIREWARLRRWLDASRADLRVQRQLMGAATEWARAGADASFLASGARLAQFEALADSGDLALNETEAEYIYASKVEQGRQTLAEQVRQAHELELARRSEMAQRSASNRLRALVGVLAVFLLAAIGLSAFALSQRTEALNSAATSVANAATATIAQGQALNNAATSVANQTRVEALRLASEARRLSQANGDPALVALLSIRSVQTQYAPQGDQVLAEAATLQYPVRLFGGDERVVSSVFSPDGRYVATGGINGKVRIWDAQSGGEVTHFADTDSVFSMAFSRDGKYLLEGGISKIAHLWEVQTGIEMQSFSGHKDAISTVALSPDGAYVLTTSFGEQIARLWNARSGQQLRSFPAYFLEYPVFSPDGHTMLTIEGGGGSGEATARFRDIQTGAEVRHFPIDIDSVLVLVFSPDGRSILTSSLDKTVRMWDAQTGKELRRFTGHSETVGSLAFSPNGAYVLTGGNDRTARLWDAQTGRQLLVFSGQMTSPDVAFSPNGRYVLTTDGTAHLWDTQPNNALIGHTDAISGVAFSPDGTSLLTGSTDGMARLWDAQSGAEHYVLNFSLGDSSSTPASIMGAMFSPDGKYALTIHSNLPTVAILWDTRTGKQVRTFDFPDDSSNDDDFVTTAAYAPDGTYVLTVSQGGALRMWDPQTGNMLRMFPAAEASSNNISGVAISPDSKYLISVEQSGTAQRWDVQTGKMVKDFAHRSAGYSLASVAYSPDGKYVIVGTSNHTAELWDAQTGKMLRAYTGHTDTVVDAIFTPDDKHVLTSSLDHTIRLWDIQTGAELRRFTSISGVMTHIAISPDGKRLLAGGDDPTVRLWDLDTGDMITSICARLSRDLTADERAQYSITNNKPTCP